jgi:hypothetical protein
MGLHDNFEKYSNNRTKRCGIERLHDNFKIYRSLLEYIVGILTYAKVYNEGIATHLETILMHIKI